MFKKELLKYAPKREYKKVYSIIILEAYKKQTRERQNEKVQLLNQIKDYEGRLSKARDLLMTNQIDSADNRDIKSDYRDTLARLQARYLGLLIDMILQNYLIRELKICLGFILSMIILNL